MFKKTNKKNTTDKYQCCNCKQRNMYPNKSFGYIRGFKCAQCGAINYPNRDMLISNIEIKEKPMEFPNETLNGIPPLVIVCGTEFTICNLCDDARIWLKPKLMRNSSALVISDPDGSLLELYSKQLKRNGYKIKVINTTDFTKSARYNPFAYFRSDADIAKLVTALMRGTKGNGKPGDYSFITAETNLLIALVGYLYSEAMEFERNFSSLLEMLESMEPHRSHHNDSDAIDFMFEAKEIREPDHLCVTRYNHFKFAVKNKEDIINSCIARLTPLNTAEMRDFFSNNELEIGELFSPKTALFTIAGDTDDAYKFIVPLMYSQLINVICEETVK